MSLPDSSGFWTSLAPWLISVMNDLNEVFKLAKALGVEGAFLTSCELRYSLDTVLPSRVVAAIERQPVTSAQAHALWERIVTGPANPQTAHQGTALSVRLEPGSRSRWTRCMRCFQPSQPDHLWAQQHNINARWMLFLRLFGFSRNTAPRAPDGS
jgi:hypothetical protein